MATKEFPDELLGKVKGINPDINIDRNQLIAEMAQEVIANFSN
ncbi:hypothetical protein [Lactococcus cremoris]|nr:hypothetical protein [Lactococcus cremoris]